MNKDPFYESINNKKEDPHNIEISETGYGYVPVDAEKENNPRIEIEKD
ncbi:hypothetical protein H1D32_10170 [Anaerobacillus sp. CMMVII]|nr:hypothetical protein [Anaerobacillus sp. CMMVII]MCT8138086.1 hypothetical protein [Anaerobacillus sp. CMMVII]